MKFFYGFCANYKGVSRKGHRKILFAPGTIKNFMDLLGFPTVSYKLKKPEAVGFETDFLLRYMRQTGNAGTQR
jgi:hypothetical protein